MISHDELLRTKRDDILLIAAKYGASNVRVFGSVARGEADEQSDIDLLVDLEPKRSLLELAGLLVDLEELLGCKVDVVPEDSLRKRIKDRVLKQEVPWQQISKMRNVLIPIYFGVDTDIIWAVVEHDLPTLKASVDALLTGQEGTSNT
jgi:predicted nucleotidyltransferase